MPQRTGSLGCLGLVSVILLTLFTAAEVGGLVWLNPNWVDRIAFWRGPIYPKDPVFEPAVAIERPKRVVMNGLMPDGLWVEGRRAVEVEYDPTRGATLTTKEGAQIELPPGCIREAATVQVAPVMAVTPAFLNKNMAVAGPCYKIYVGGQPHYKFAKPIRVTVPYQKELLGAGGSTEGLALFVSESGPWERCPSVVNERTQTVTAQVTHCSGLLCGVYWIGTRIILPLAILNYTSATGKGLVNRRVIRAFRRDTYDTRNFSIHYTTTGDDAVPSDAEFPLKPATPRAGIPNFVVYVGETLEEIRPTMGDVGVPVPEGMLTRHEVFLENIVAFGDTPAGGPLWITTNWKDPNGKSFKPQDWDRWLRGTLAHELVHVSQNDFFGVGQLRDNGWWMEMSAAYLADLAWEKRGRPTAMVREYYLPMTGGRLTNASMFVEPKEQQYAWAAFLQWLEERKSQQQVQDLVRSINKSGSASIDDFDHALNATYGKPLAALLSDFAESYYHDDLWAGHIMPLKFYQNASRVEAGVQSLGSYGDFALVTEVGSTGRWNGGLRLLRQEQTPEILPLTSYAFIMHIESLPEYRKAKLVVDMESETRDAFKQTRVAQDQIGPGLPATGSPQPFVRIVGDPRVQEWERTGKAFVFKDIHSGGTDRVTVLVSNPSTTENLPALRVERYLLLRPEWVNSQRRAPNKWWVGWDPTPLWDDPSGKKILAGYNVYRKGPGDKEFPKTPDYKFKVSDFGAAMLGKEVDVPETRDYVFTATAEDINGVESDPADLDTRDAFEGRWSGSVTLVKGNLAKPIIDAMNNGIRDRKAKAKASIDKLKNNATGATDQETRDGYLRQAERETKAMEEDERQMKGIVDFLGSILQTGEFAARLGIPIDFEVRRVNNEYEMQVKTVLWQDAGMKEWIPMVRTGRHTLGFKRENRGAGLAANTQPTTAPAMKGIPPVYLQLHREDEIRDNYVMTPTKDDGTAEQTFQIKWAFTRSR